MDYPFQEENRVFIPLNVQYTINIIPKMVFADEKLKHYSLKARKCFIKESEWRHMKIYKVSTVANEISYLYLHKSHFVSKRNTPLTTVNSSALLNYP